MTSSWLVPTFAGLEAGHGVRGPTFTDRAYSPRTYAVHRMSSTAGPIPESYGPSGGPDPRRWLYVGLAALFVLIGVSVVLNVAVALWQNHPLSWSVNVQPWNWLLGVIGVLLAIWIVVWILRILLWGVMGAHYDRPWRHHRHRWYYYHGGPYGIDPAVEIARERYARGELTKEQLDQILSHLGSTPSPPPPPP